MVQLIEKVVTPKTNKLTMAKVKTPAQTPKVVAMKAKMNAGTPERTPKTPKQPKTPKTPKAFKLDDTPKSKKSPKVPKTPQTEVPDLDTTPKKSPKVKTPKMHKTPKSPKAPKSPKEPKTPKTPKVPKTPQVEVKPEADISITKSPKVKTPKQPKTPKAAETPKVLKVEGTPKPKKSPKVEVLSEPESSPKKSAEGKQTPKQKKHSKLAVTPDSEITLKKSKKRSASESAENGEASESPNKKMKVGERERTVFVAHLDWNLGHNNIKDIFSKYGDIERVNMSKPFRPGKRNGGYAFVVFAEKEQRDKVLASKPEHNGNPLFVTDSQQKRKRAEGAEDDSRPSKRRAVASDRSVFVGSITSAVSSEDIREHFGQFGEVESVSIPVNNKPSKFGFVEYKSPASQAKALKQANHEINGCKLKVNEIRSKSSDEKKAFAKGPEVKVFKLDRDMSADDVKGHFAQFGKVTGITMPLVPDSKQNKGFAFVTFSSEKEMLAAAKVESQQINGHNVMCVINRASMDKNPTRECEVVVKQIPSSASRDDVKKYFEKFGTVVGITMPYNVATKKYKGYAFVGFTSQQVARSVAEQEEHEIHGDIIECHLNGEKKGKKAEVKKVEKMEVEDSDEEAEDDSSEEAEDDDDEEGEDDDDDDEEDDDDDEEAEEDDDDDEEAEDDDDDDDEAEDDEEDDDDDDDDEDDE